MELARVSLAVVAVVIQACLSVLAQDASVVQPSRKNGFQVALSRIGTETQSQEQKNLRIRFLNAADITIVLPTPTVLCGDSLGGFVMVYKKRLSPSKNPETGRGCVVDRFARKDILAEAKTWKELAPRETYDVTVPLAALSLIPDARYALRAKYYPAHFKVEELSTLAAHGINVVRQTAESEPIIIEPPE